MSSAILLADMMHWDEGGWFWMALMMIVGAIVVVLLIYFLARAFSNPGEWGGRESTETPLDVAKRRYTSGNDGDRVSLAFTLHKDLSCAKCLALVIMKR